MEISDWVLILTALFLGAVALYVPYFAEFLKRKWFAPDLEITFKEERPDCHKTRTEANVHVYYFRFRVKNTGKSQAKGCEVVIENVLSADSRGNYESILDTPVNLIWGSGNDVYVNINPDRWFYCDLLNIPCPKPPFYGPDYTTPDSTNIILNMKTVFFSQGNVFEPGKYLMTVSVYSENCKKVSATFKIYLSGKWQDDVEDMFKEVAVNLKGDQK